MKIWKISTIALAVVTLPALAYQGVQISKLSEDVEKRSKPNAHVRADGGGDSYSSETSIDAARIARLENKVASLEKALTDAGQEIPQVTASVSDAEVAEIRRDLDSLATSGSIDTSEGRDALRKAIREEQQNEREQRRQEWIERRTAEEDKALAELADKNGFSDRQLEEVSGALKAERDQRTALWQDVRSGNKGFRDARKEMDGYRTATDDVVAGVLDTDQFSAYQEMREEMNPRGRRH